MLILTVGVLTVNAFAFLVIKSSIQDIDNDY